MRKAICTGAGGFIASHLQDRLINDGWEVYGIDDLSRGSKKYINPKVKFIKKSVEALKPNKIFKGAVVFHLAAWARVQQSMIDSHNYFKKNVIATENLLEICKNTAERVIFASSSSVYGDLECKKDGFKPADITNPMSPYASQKLIGEFLMRQYATCHDLPTLSLRFFNVYGERMADEGAYVTVIKKFIDQRRNRKPFTIWGTGQQTRDFTHVLDIVNGLIKAANLNSECKTDNWRSIFNGRVLNLGSGDPKSVLQIADLIEPDWPKEYLEGKKEPQNTKADYFLSNVLLKWSPKIKIDEGIKNLLS